MGGDCAISCVTMGWSIQTQALARLATDEMVTSGATSMRDATSEAAAGQRVVVVMVVVVFSIVAPKINGVERRVGGVAETPNRGALTHADGRVVARRWSRVLWGPYTHPPAASGRWSVMKRFSRGVAGSQRPAKSRDLNAIA